MRIWTSKKPKKGEQTSAMHHKPKCDCLTSMTLLVFSVPFGQAACHYGLYTCVRPKRIHPIKGLGSTFDSDFQIPNLIEELTWREQGRCKLLHDLHVAWIGKLLKHVAIQENETCWACKYLVFKGIYHNSVPLLWVSREREGEREREEREKNKWNPSIQPTRLLLRTLTIGASFQMEYGYPERRTFNPSHSAKIVTNSFLLLLVRHLLLLAWHLLLLASCYY